MVDIDAKMQLFAWVNGLLFVLWAATFGTYVYRDTQKRGLAKSSALFWTLLAAFFIPMGILLYLFNRFLRRQPT